MKWFLSGCLGVLSSAMVGCAQKGGTKDILTPDYLLAKGTQQVTFLGDNDRPRFSKDNQRLIYSSRQRAAHRGSQIYEMDIAKSKERRVTFSDGDAFDPVYVTDAEILYASTTDEIKESPFINKTFQADSPPSDLYMSDLYGTDVIRLTQQPGYDAQPIYLDGRTPAIVFASRRGELFGIYRLDLKNLPVSLISAQKGRARRHPALSPDRLNVAWVDKDLKTDEESLVLYNLRKQMPLVLKSGEGQYRDLFFAPKTPQRLFYSIQRKGEKFYQLEVYNLETHCTQVVFKGADSLFSPAVSSEATERLAFTRLFQDKKQIYIVTLPADLGPCLEAPSQATLKE